MFIKGSSRATLSSRSSLPAPESSRIKKIQEKRHSLDSQNYSKCQEGIESIEKLCLHELMAEERPQSLDTLEKVKKEHHESKNTASDSALTLKPLERPSRPPPSIPVSRAESLEKPKRSIPAIPVPRTSSEPHL